MGDVLERLRERNAGRTAYEGQVDLLFDAQREIESLRQQLRERDRDWVPVKLIRDAMLRFGIVDADWLIECAKQEQSRSAPAAEEK